MLGIAFLATFLVSSLFGIHSPAAHRRRRIRLAKSRAARRALPPPCSIRNIVGLCRIHGLSIGADHLRPNRREVVAGGPVSVL